MVLINQNDRMIVHLYGLESGPFND